MSLLNKGKFYAVDDLAPPVKGELTRDGILDDLNLEDEPEVKEEEDKEEEPEKKEEEEEIDELKELEEELEEPDPDKLELTVPVKRSTILKEYPDLFKKFPYLERAYYREQQYTELLPTIDDAKQAVEKSSILDHFEHELLSGKTEGVLKTIKDSDSGAFNKVIDDYLPALQRVDPQAWQHVVGNLIKQTIIQMSQEANTQGLEENGRGQPLQAAATILHQFVFGSSQWQPPKQLFTEKKDNTEETRLNNERREFTKQRFETARDGLANKVNNSIRSSIDQHLDPKGSMTAYVKKTAARDAEETLQTLIDRDGRFRTILDKLWENAFKNNFNQDSQDRIRSAYLSKAKTLLPSVIKKARNEALKGSGGRVSNNEPDVEDDEDSTNKVPKKKVQSSGPINRGRTDKDKAQQIPKGMTTLEFLNKD